jgi:hypothetical protein
MKKKQPTLAELLAMPDADDIDFEIPSRHERVRDVDLS